jgi:hypothetical protein
LTLERHSELRFKPAWSSVGVLYMQIIGVLRGTLKTLLIVTCMPAIAVLPPPPRAKHETKVRCFRKILARSLCIESPWCIWKLYTQGCPGGPTKMVLGQCRPFWGAFRSSPKNRQKQGALIKCVFTRRPRLSPFEGCLSARAVGVL